MTWKLKNNYSFKYYFFSLSIKFNILFLNQMFSMWSHFPKISSTYKDKYAIFTKYSPNVNDFF